MKREKLRDRGGGKQRETKMQKDERRHGTAQHTIKDGGESSRPYK